VRGFGLISPFAFCSCPGGLCAVLLSCLDWDDRVNARITQSWQELAKGRVNFFSSVLAQPKWAALEGNSP